MWEKDDDEERGGRRKYLPATNFNVKPTHNFPLCNRILFNLAYITYYTVLRMRMRMRTRQERETFSQEITIAYLNLEHVTKQFST